MSRKPDRPRSPHWVDLADVADAAALAMVDGLTPDEERQVGMVLRGVSLRFHVETRRQLWQACAQEVIEPDQLDWIDSIKPGSWLVDAGASTGVFSAYAGKRGVQAVAFEPDPLNFSLLARNAALNAPSRPGSLLAFCVALHDQTGVCRLYCADLEAGSHNKIVNDTRIPGGHRFPPRFVRTIQGWRLDDFLRYANLCPPDFLKIDVDGAEGALLQGAEKTLGDPRLRGIFIEIDETSPASRQALELLQSAGFEVTGSRQVQHYEGLRNYVLSRSGGGGIPA